LETALGDVVAVGKLKKERSIEGVVVVIVDVAADEVTVEVAVLFGLTSTLPST
jgi:hypothetical protein